MSNECLMVVDGRNGQVHLYSNRLEIHRAGFMAKVSHGFGKGIKEINLKSITAIQLKKSGLLVGYIQFVFSGSDETKKGTFSAVKDENSVTFIGDKPYAEFQRLKDKIYELQSAVESGGRNGGSNSTSVADEIAKLWELGRQGLITREEFEMQKKKLLEGKS